MIYIIMFLLIAVLWWVVENLILKLFRKWSAEDFCLTDIIEKRITRVNTGKMFHKFIYVSKDECFAYQRNPHRKYQNERDKYEIVPGVYDFNQELNWFQQYIFKHNGSLWYQPLRFGRNIYVRKLEIFVYDSAQNKMVPLENNLSKYLYRSWYKYGVLVSGVEDATGNPISFYIEWEMRVSNPYIAGVEIVEWDKLIASKIRTEVLSIGNNYYFYKDLPLKDGVDKSKIIVKGEKSDDKDGNGEIIDVIDKELARAFSLINTGFEIRNFLTQNIVAERQDITNAIAETFISGEELKQTLNEAKGIKELESAPKEADYEYRQNLFILMNDYPQAANLYTRERMTGNANAVAFGNQDTMFFDVPVENKPRGQEPVRRSYKKSQTETKAEVKNETNAA